MRYHCIVPARMGSKRFFGKPLCLVGDKKLAARSFHCANRCSLFSKVHFAHDLPDRYLAWLGVTNEIPTGVHPSGTDRVAEAARILEILDEDIVVNVQGDMAYFHPGVLHDLCGAFANDSDLEVATLASSFNPGGVTHNASVFVPETGEASFSREYSDEFFCGQLGIYAFKNKVLQEIAETPAELDMEQERFLDYNFRVIIGPYKFAEVNEFRDVEFAERMIRCS